MVTALVIKQVDTTASEFFFQYPHRLEYKRWDVSWWFISTGKDTSSGDMDFSLVICAVQSAINEHPTSWIHRRHAQGLFSTSKTVQRRRLTDEHEQHDVRHTPSPIKIGWCDVVRLLWTNLAPSVLLRHALAYETQRRLFFSSRIASWMELVCLEWTQSVFLRDQLAWSRAKQWMQWLRSLHWETAYWAEH